MKVPGIHGKAPPDPSRVIFSSSKCIAPSTEPVKSSRRAPSLCHPTRIFPIVWCLAILTEILEDAFTSEYLDVAPRTLLISSKEDYFTSTPSSP